MLTVFLAVNNCPCSSGTDGRLKPMKPINDLLATHGVAVYDPDDATLSSGEHAQAIIVAALVEQWDRLDGNQQQWIH